VTAEEPPEAPALEKERELVAVENLARTEALAVWARRRAGGAPDAQVLVLAGRGLPGAAALAAARHLSNYGLAPRTLLCGPAHRFSAAAALQKGILAAMGVRTPEAGPGELAASVAALGPGDELLDGSGDPAAPGVEGELARAARGATRAGRVARLEPRPDYQPPAPGRTDVVFSPEARPCTREDSRLYDSVAISRFGIPGLVLMENAGWRTAREAWAMLGWAPGEVLVLAGAGNNGGDGLVAARHLALWGARVEVLLVASREKVLDDARTNLELAEASGLRIREAPTAAAVDSALAELLPRAALVVDALLGTGLSGRVRGAIERAIELVNAAGRRVLAVDIPSGLDANTGEVLGCAIRAERTVTFGFPKAGFFRANGPALAGELAVADISLPRELWLPPPA